MKTDRCVRSTYRWVRSSQMWHVRFIWQHKVHFSLLMSCLVCGLTASPGSTAQKTLPFYSLHFDKYLCAQTERNFIHCFVSETLQVSDWDMKGRTAVTAWSYRSFFNLFSHSSWLVLCKITEDSSNATLQAASARLTESVWFQLKEMRRINSPHSPYRENICFSEGWTISDKFNNWSQQYQQAVFPGTEL